MARHSNIEEAAEAAAELQDPRDIVDKDGEISLGEILDGTFIAGNTDFDTVEGMIAASPSAASDVDGLERIPRGEWDEFLAETTIFDDEEEFVFAARDHWVAKQLDL